MQRMEIVVFGKRIRKVNTNPKVKFISGFSHFINELTFLYKRMTGSSLCAKLNTRIPNFNILSFPSSFDREAGSSKIELVLPGISLELGA